MKSKVSGFPTRKRRAGNPLAYDNPFLNEPSNRTGFVQAVRVPRHGYITGIP